MKRLFNHQKLKKRQKTKTNVRKNELLRYRLKTAFLIDIS